MVNSRTILTVLICFGIQFCSVSQVCAQTTYFVHPSGSDKNAGTDIELPLQTIQKCVDLLKSPGDACRLKSGRYTPLETVSLYALSLSALLSLTYSFSSSSL